MNLILEFDDFSPKNSCLGLLEDLKDHYKDFKVTLFTVPWEIRWGEPTPITMEKFLPFCEAVKRSSDWMEIALHGLTHLQGEFKDLTYEEAYKRILVGEKMFINRGITYTKIFKAPHWQLSPGSERAAMALGWKVVKDHYYSWNLKDEMPKFADDATVIAHGHIQNVCDNGLEDSMPKLMSLPKNTKFMFLSEVLKADKVDGKKAMQLLKEVKDGKFTGGI